MSSGQTPEQEFLRYIQLALGGDRSAGAKICDYQQKDVRGYFKILATILSNDSLPEDARLGAGLIWKNFFNLKSEESREQRAEQWLALPRDFREPLKICALRGLTSKKKSVYRVSVQVVAKIAHIELTAEQWPQLAKHFFTQITAADNTHESSSEGIPSIDPAHLKDIANVLTQATLEEEAEPQDEQDEDFQVEVGEEEDTVEEYEYKNKFNL